MSYPTGMGRGTGMHYQNVAAQMQNYLQAPAQRRGYSYAQSPYYGAPAPMIASEAFRYGAQRMGVNPMVVNDLGGFARGFMRNLLS